ncbi:MAG: DNA recombination protein RmuC [Bacteroidales bacterium]|nr:DNA recombination protein RmuC [Bacteroidales bacterium]
MELLYIISGLIIGGIAGYVIATLVARSRSVSRTEHEKAQDELNSANNENATLKARLETSQEFIGTLKSEIAELKTEVGNKITEYSELNKRTAVLDANNKALAEKLETQKKEIEELGKKFNTEFENIANKILDDKTLKFTKQNRDNLEVILKPLGENINTFRKKVEEVYDKESKERFSLGKELERLVELNQKVSEEANNLTKALRGSSKAQGDWGQMILEKILEQSGLAKDREYFVQEFLKDEDGNIIKTEQGRKMQPDVIISYPDNRKLIIDSKVSLTAYTRYSESDDPEVQDISLKGHLESMRTHIDELSAKNYQGFTASLDFVMMFVPNEPAYLLALKNDPDLWHYAYSKRILFISPTNLIAALKMIADLWKREYQNQNALAIADRGAALYDKFVGFVETLSGLGTQIDKAQKSYDTAMGQLRDGKGNLIGQAEKLRELGVKTKKELPKSMLDE